MPHHAAWPQTERAFASLTGSEAEAVRERDDRRLQLEKSRVAPHIAEKMKEPTHSVFRMMKEWELMVEAVAREGDVEPRPLLDDYLFALDTRAGLEEALHDLAPRPPGPLAETLESLDQRFLHHTLPDNPTDEATLSPWLTPMERRPPLWLWNRRPQVNPW
ncbi:hypothetical protein [Streptomyces iconiensis]|uniref:Uncharacterized protein n=1 Tax=Streptomyces iconiensis TaxID=1384038 RepID=A0ABT7A5R8_9ACTN|nr:hypothetical protein [Streptomyces iconiensis]MDJ1136636.1 hypothetical protein [Streptomyces iconiensis]